MSEMKGRVERVDLMVRGLLGEMHRLALQLHDVTTRVAQLKDK